MKKILTVLLIIVLACNLFGCEISKEYKTAFVTPTNNKVDTELLDIIFSNTFERYNGIKNNVPSLPLYIMDITPDFLKEKCSIYKFNSKSAGLQWETFILIDNELYGIGCAVGGYGVTEFAYASKSEKLYFIYSWGSGTHRSLLGVFDFKTRETYNFCVDTIAWMHDMTFDLSLDKKTVGICYAEITWADYETGQVEIKKGEKILNDIEQFKCVKTK